MRVLLCGGGTGGHIYPALALARYLVKKRSDVEVLFVGGEKGLENQLVPREGFELVSISMRANSRNVFKLPRTLWNLGKSSYQVHGILRKYSPHVVIGTGGYVTAPVLFWSGIKKIPSLIHEQNAVPGKTNRALAPLVNKVCLSFEFSSQFFSKKANTVVTGNPRASEVQAISKKEGCNNLGLSPYKRTLLVFGGSQGAWKINSVMINCIKEKLLPASIQVLYVTGDRYFKEVQDELSKNTLNQVFLQPYLHDMPSALAAADLVVCRAGATAIAEITARGVPALLIPSPNVVDNHQYYNARIMEQNDAARVILEKDFSSFTFSKNIKFLFDHPENLDTMANNSGALGVPQAVELMYNQIIAIAKNSEESVFK